MAILQVDVGDETLKAIDILATKLGQTPEEWAKAVLLETLGVVLIEAEDAEAEKERVAVLTQASADASAAKDARMEAFRDSLKVLD